MPKLRTREGTPRGPFRNILIATDGSRLAAKGASAGVQLARALGAKVLGVYVIRARMPALYGEAAVYYTDRDFSPGAYGKRSEREARKALALLEAQARAAKVACSTRIIKRRHAWRGILDAARAAKCDAIAMASHGRSGIGGLLLGSQTQQVLARAGIPVMVIR